MIKIPQKAILIIYFNRPKILKLLLMSLKKFKPSSIYFSCDGPRLSNNSDEERIKACNLLIDKYVDWPCKKKFMRAEANIGCDNWVPQSISWFFFHEESGIILEDDCLIDENFYNFSSYLLDKYADNEKVMNIAALNPNTSNEKEKDYDYFYSYYPLTWGWATWRRAWDYYNHDIKMENYNSLIKKHLISKGFTNYELIYWNKFFTRLEQQKVLFWDIKWIYSIWLRGACSITPSRNLVANIGFGKDATHTKFTVGTPYGKKIYSIQFPLRKASSNLYYLIDRTIFKVRFKATIFKKIIHVITSFLGHFR
jgi:hypothetical protein